MNVWKSPVFYFGILLLAAVIGALAAPFVYDWNAYKADLEAYGRKLTGRPVAIEGPISVRFFTWPSLTANGVRIANPPGLVHKDFATADRIAVRMQLAGLFSGNIDVESITVDRPVIVLERMATGEVNWELQPAADLKGNELLGRVKLDHINLNDATIRLIDRRRGLGDVQFRAPLVTMASPGVSGPWRIEAKSVAAGDRSLDIGINTATWVPGEALRFSLRVAGADGSGAAATFDGNVKDYRAAGNLRIEPAAGKGEKSDAEGQLRPMVLSAKVVASFDAVALDKIEIMPRDPKDGGTLMSGSAKLALGAKIGAEVALSAVRLDLEQLAGAQANQVLREGGSLAVADALLALLPEATNLGGSLTVTSLQAGGETLENVALRVEASRAAIRVRELSASLPGRSRVLFEGVFFPGSAGAELAGNLALETNDLRLLTGWLAPEVKDAVGRSWTGSRGRFKMQTEVSLTPSRFRLTKTQFEIDGVAGSGEVSVALGGRLSIDLRGDADRIDLDSFSPGGFQVMADDGRLGLTGLVSLLAPRRDAADLRLTLKTRELVLNGATARDVLVDVASGANGLDVRALRIASVEGASLDVSGLVLDTGKGPDGSIGYSVRAEDPRGLLRLLGLFAGDQEPAWAAALGTTAVHGTVTTRTEAAGPVTGLDIEGTSGAYEVVASGEVTAGGDLGQAGLRGSADIKAGSSSAMARLAGLLPAGDDTTPSRLLLTASGSLQDGFLADLTVDAYGTRLNYNGKLGVAEAGPMLDGQLALRSTDTGALLAASGLPMAAVPANVLVLDGHLSGDGGQLSIPDLSGRFGQVPVSGDVKIAADRRVTANLSLGDMTLTDVLAATFLEWNGVAPESGSSFAARLPFGITGEAWIHPASLKVHDTFTAQDVQIGITATAEEIRLAMFGKDAAGRDARIELGSRGNDGSRAVDGKVTLPFDLARQVRLAGGSPVADGTGVITLGFEAQGRSPGGALTALKGSGAYTVRGLTIRGVSPREFAELLGKATDAAGLNAAFDGLRSGSGLAAGDISGTIVVDNGVAAFLPFKVSTPEAEVMVKVMAEPAAATLDASLVLQLKSQAAMPSMEVSYAGPPTALARNEDKTELSAKLNFDIMQQGVIELERLQKEQQRLAAEEEKQRLEDEARLQAYYAQRDELRLRQRELRVHADVRLQEAQELRRRIESERAANAEMNKSELKQRQRELRIHRRVARLEKQTQAEPVAPPPRPKAVVKRTQPKAETAPEIAVPVVIVPPLPPTQQ